MFICNVKLNNNIMKTIVIILFILILIGVFTVVGYRFYDATSKIVVEDELPDNKSSQLEINAGNYTDILKDSHENIDKYVGKSIKFVGFVYRLYDFSENQFVLARQMIISSDNKAVVVGFLCDGSTTSVNTVNFKDGDWVEVEGVIVKGNYHGDIPVVEVKCINRSDVPCDEFVYPPSGSYINTEI